MRAPDRPAVVLLHSSGSTPRQWQELSALLGPEFRVLDVEFHGHGQRAAWPHERAMALADDAALAAPLLADGAHVVGHSYGGAVAIKLACMHPERVHGVVAYEPVLFRLLIECDARAECLRQVLQVADGMRKCVKDGDAAEAGRMFVDFWSGAGAWEAMPRPVQQSTQRRMASVVRHFDALFAEPFPVEQLARMAKPLLFLSGGCTVPAAGRIAQLLRKALPHAQHEELPGLGHLGPITHARVVNERVRAFLLHHALH